jgi:chemotaxis protein methyltransferase CheR
MNLLSDYSGVGPFDIVLCRNVLIYFNLVQKTEVIRRLCRCLRSGGYLMLGASESPMGSTLPIFADPDLNGCYSWVEPGPTVASNAARALRLN